MATIDDPIKKFKPDPLDLMELIDSGDPADVIMDNKLKGVKERKKNKAKKEMEAAGKKPTEEDIEKAASEAMKELKEAGKAQVKAIFENTQSQFDEITALAIAIPAALAGLIAQLALIDPMAPVASMGVVNSAIANIKNLKGQINTFKTTVSNFTQNLGKLDITLPESISEASSAVNDAESNSPSDFELESKARISFTLKHAGAYTNNVAITRFTEDNSTGEPVTYDQSYQLIDPASTEGEIKYCSYRALTFPISGTSMDPNYNGMRIMLNDEVIAECDSNVSNLNFTIDQLGSYTVETK